MVSEIQDDIYIAVIRNIYSIQPLGMLERDSVFCIGQEVDLVYVKRMEFSALVDDPPMLIRTHASGCHRTRVRLKFAAIDIKAVLVLSERDGEIRRPFLQRLHVDWLVKWRTVINGMRLLRRWISIGVDPICQHHPWIGSFRW